MPAYCIMHHLEVDFPALTKTFSQHSFISQFGPYISIVLPFCCNIFVGTLAPSIKFCT